MDNAEPAHVPESLAQTTASAEQSLRRLERRDWLLWTVAILVMLLLTFAVYTFTLTPPGGKADTWWESEQIAFRSLLGLILLFSLFAVHRQLVVNRLRRQVSSQLSLMAALETRAELFHKLAILDPLTGLYNRRFAMQHLPTEMARAERQQYRLTVASFDLNDLKLINEAHGHSGGDLVLREFGAALRRAVRSSDIAVRIGGDEFLVILPECEPDHLPQVLARLSGLEVDFRGHKIELSFAAGWAEHLRGETLEELLNRADHQLYEDKRTGSARLQALAAREHLRQAEKLTTMGWLTTSVAHDFNNLLTIIKGYTEMALGRLVGDVELHDQVQEVHKAAERAISLTGQLLAFSRKQALDPKVADLNALLSGMQMMLHRLIGDHIQLTFEAGADLYPVCVDVGQAEQIVMNLAANARDAMAHGGTLLIQTSNFEIDAAFCASHRGARPGSYVRLLVRDTGVGMDEETQNRIFEPFFTTKQPGRGTGLGLSTVYGIVKQNGGYIWVESEPGQGTYVSVYLLRLPQHELAPVAPVEVAAALTTVPSGSPTILVVESFLALQRFMCDFLRQQHYNVLPCSSAEAAIQLAAEREESIDLAICDLILPGMSGIELAESLGSRRPGMKMLYVSGYAEDALLYRGWLKGDAEFLTAPFTPEEFSEKLHRLLQPVR